MSTEKSKEEHKLWETWKKDPKPEHLQALYNSLQPLIKAETLKWKQTGINPVVLEGHAEGLVFNALNSFEPTKSQLNTHVVNHLQRMNRFAINNQQAVRAQEEDVFQYRKHNKMKEELGAELGREATEEDMKKHYGNAGAVGNYKPLIEHHYSKNIEAGGSSPVMEELTMHVTAMSMMYDKLNERDKRIFENAYGYNGAPVMAKKDIAAREKLTPAAVSKVLRKLEKSHQEYAEAMDNITN